MCINCNLFLPVRPSVVTRLYIVDPPSTNDGSVLMSHRQMTAALKRRCVTTDLSTLFPEVGLGITVDAVEELDLEPLFERDGLHAINFANADGHLWTVLEEHDGYALGTVVPKVGDDVPPPRVMPPGYPLTRLCYQSCAAMMRALARPGGAATMQDMLSGDKPSWLVAEDEYEGGGMHVGNNDVAETGDAGGGTNKWMCAIM